MVKKTVFIPEQWAYFDGIDFSTRFEWDGKDKYKMMIRRGDVAMWIPVESGFIEWLSGAFDCIVETRKNDE